MVKFTDIGVELEECDGMIPEVIPKIKVPLLLNQRIMINEIAKRERLGIGEFTVKGKKEKMTCNVNYIGDPMGSGKTLSILGLHAFNKEIKHVPIITKQKIFEDNSLIERLGFHYTFGDRRLYPSKVIETTMVLVCNATFNHWLNEIKNKTELTVFPMKNIRDLNKLKKEKDNLIDGKYDIMLVNNYKTTKKYSLMDKIIEDMGLIFWKRFVPDDIATVEIHNSKKIGLPLALSYVIPYSSINSSPKNFLIKETKCELEIAKNPIYEKFRTSFNDLLYGLIVKNNPETIRIAIQIPQINYFEYMLINPDKNALNILRELGLNNEDMVELNNDNLEVIAGQLNVRVKSIFDLAHRLLGKLLTENERIVKIVEKINISLEKEKVYEDYSIEDELEKANNLIIPKVDSTYSNEWLDYSKTVNKKKEQNLTKLRNLQENLEYKECQNCGLEFGEETNAFMVPCCQYVFCDECIILDNKTGNTTKPCLHCGKKNTFKQLILIPFKIIDEIEEVEEKIMDKTEVEIINVKPKEDLSEEELIKAGHVSKMDFLVHLIKSQTCLREPKEIKYISENLLEGKDDVPPKPEERQYIIFGAAKHREIADKLNENGIPATVLQGSHTIMKKIFSSFKSGEFKALILNARVDFAGFDECSHATDCVFMGNLCDNMKTEQALARLHRKGKRFNTRVHFIRFDTEQSFSST